jgi:probable rRNA maturation factor
MKKLNEQYRGVESTTDVLSFPQIETQNLRLKTQNFILGDIVINLHKAQRQAAEYNLSFYEELKRLLVHGLLHLIHYDHKTSQHHKKKMKAKEKELLEALRHL